MTSMLLAQTLPAHHLNSIRIASTHRACDSNSDHIASPHIATVHTGHKNVEPMSSWCRARNSLSHRKSCGAHLQVVSREGVMMFKLRTGLRAIVASGITLLCSLLVFANHVPDASAQGRTSALVEKINAN